MNQDSAELVTRIRNFSVQLSPTPRGARLARLLATEQLRSWGLPLEPAAHLVAELAANAVTHGRVPGRDFRLLVRVAGDTVRIEVTDTRADRLPHVERVAPEAESGRGLAIIDALADRWGVTPGPPPRKTVWAEVDLSPKPRTPCSGGADDQPQRNPRGKAPHPNPPLPPAARAHSGG
ncbi:ATP-binding protein [Streptomyces sp. NPDC056479]|uniref:ATP-binding protein n=1 Tax=unclassified Streptomyces TaxID=2593676 RepID=UPI00367C1502